MRSLPYYMWLLVRKYSVDLNNNDYLFRIFVLLRFTE